MDNTAGGRSTWGSAIAEVDAFHLTLLSHPSCQLLLLQVLFTTDEFVAEKNMRTFRPRMNRSFPLNEWEQLT